MSDLRDKAKKEAFNNYVNTYLESLELPKVISKISKAAYYHSYSNYNRILNSQYMLENLSSAQNSETVVCFKVTRKQTSCIYGFVFIGTDNEINFYSFGGTFTSSDGEYRRRAIAFSALQKYKLQYAEQFAIVEAMVVEKFANSEISFQTDFFFDERVKDKQNETAIANSRLMIDLYVMCWMHDYHNIHYKIMENHTNPAYTYIIYQKRDFGVYKQLFDSIKPPNTFQDFQLDISDIVGKSDFAGLKIIPMTVHDLTEYNDLKYPIWRELYAMYACASLVIGGICYSFPQAGTWFYIQNTHGGLYDNYSMHQKLQNTATAKAMVDKISQIEDLTHSQSSPSNMDSSVYINDKFRRVSKRLNNTIQYIESNLDYTNTAMCMVFEDRGRTFRDYPQLVKSGVYFPRTEEVFTQAVMFKRLMFEYVYGCVCMNSHLWLLHGDLHLNNVTIAKVQQTRDIKMSSLLLIENKYYLLPYNTNQGCIIDFSRCILGDVDKLREQYSDRYVEIYSREQTLRLFALLHMHFPSFVDSNINQLQSLAISNFPLLFKIATLIDVFVLFKNIEILYTIEKDLLNEIKAWDALKWVSELFKYAEGEIINLLQQAINETLKKPEDIPWPNLVFLHKYFTEFEITEEYLNELVEANANHDSYKTKDPVPPLGVSIPVVIDIINYNLHVKYNTRSVETWPEVLKPDIYLNAHKKYGVEPEEKIHLLPLYKNKGKIVEPAEKSKYPKAGEYYEDPWMFM